MQEPVDLQAAVEGRGDMQRTQRPAELRCPAGSFRTRDIDAG